MQEEILISIGKLKALTTAGQKTYERIWNAEIHDIYHTREVDEGRAIDWLVIKLKGVTAAELNELSNHYDSFMEAEEMMWQC